MDVVAHAEDEAFHLGVPAVRLVTKMHAGFKQLAHGKIWQCHEAEILSRLSLREAMEPFGTGWSAWISAPASRVNYARNGLSAGRI